MAIFYTGMNILVSLPCENSGVHLLDLIYESIVLIKETNTCSINCWNKLATSSEQYHFLCVLD